LWCNTATATSLHCCAWSNTPAVHPQMWMFFGPAMHF